MLKIDTQGHEISVMRGVERTIKKHRPVVIFELDYRFVYYLLGATGICVVPISSFCSKLHGFRITALEENPELMKDTTRRLAQAIRDYLDSGSR